MRYPEKTCAAIHDLSGGGKCSLTVILPVLSACGVEVSVLPTEVLSTHTGGFTAPVTRDMTADLLPMAHHWKREGFRFSALYSGYLGSAAQIDLVGEIFSLFREEHTLVAVDPVLGDGGKLYRSVTPEIAAGMKELCKQADLILPNLTEACHLLNMEYRDGPRQQGEIEAILEKLCKLGPRHAVLTGVSLREGEIGAACFSAETGKAEFYPSARVEGSYHGTGDIFASVLLGGLLNGREMGEACALAVDFTHRVIEATRAAGSEPKFGPKFEVCLPWLTARLFPGE